MRVSAVQMHVETKDVRGNLDRAYRLIQEAVRRGSRAVLLPEMWNTGFDYPDLRQAAIDTYGPTRRFLAETAREGKVWLLGTVPEPADGGVYNSLLWYSPEGELAGVYRKAHLFTPTAEDEHFKEGAEIPVVETDFGKAGGMICFDIRFPEVARKLVLGGAWVIFVPAQFPHPRSDHWVTLLRARAIENQCYIVAANRIGQSGRLEYFGRSMIIDPWGEVVEGEEAEREAVVTADLDRGRVDAVRGRLPCRRRPDLYGNFDPA